MAFTEHDHTADAAGGSSTAAHRDNNMRAAFLHVVADAAVSISAILGLAAGKLFGWVFMDPVMGVIGALVIANWSYGPIRDAGAILLDMTPDRRVKEDLRKTIESEGDRLADLHLWRRGPGTSAPLSLSSPATPWSGFLSRAARAFPHAVPRHR